RNGVDPGAPLGVPGATPTRGGRAGAARFRTTLGRSASSDFGDRGSGGARGRSNSFCSRSVSVRVDRPRTRTKSALLPRFGRGELAAYPAGSCFYCRKTSGWGGKGGTIRSFADAVWFAGTWCTRG